MRDQLADFFMARFRIEKAPVIECRIAAQCRPGEESEAYSGDPLDAACSGVRQSVLQYCPGWFSIPSDSARLVGGRLVIKGAFAIIAKPGNNFISVLDI